jgi:hypothetical protein
MSVSDTADLPGNLTADAHNPEGAGVKAPTAGNAVPALQPVVHSPDLQANVSSESMAATRPILRTERRKRRE